MIQLTWNPAQMHISDLHGTCLQNIGRQIAHQDASDHFIYSVSDLMHFKPANEEQGERTGFILKLRTSFESNCKIVLSYMIFSAPTGSYVSTSV